MATVVQGVPFGLSAPRNDLAPIAPEWPHPAPSRYIFRELTMTFNSGLQFFYRDPGLAQPLPDGGIEEVIAALAAPPPPAAAFVGAAMAMPSRETPLDLKVYGPPAYVVLALDPDLNWQFSPDHPAVSLKDKNVAAHYGGLQHVLAGGAAQPEPGLGCDLVYFIAHPPAVGLRGKYSHGFNFHIELTQSGASGNSVLPIIIDPEVGYPGGSGT